MDQTNQIKEVTINNWTCFGTNTVMVELHKHSIDDVDCYNSTLSIFLDDGNKESEDKCITIITDFWDECPFCCATTTALSIKNLFDNISDIVYVLNTDGNICEEYSLNDLTNELEHDIISELDPVTDIIIH